MENLEDDSSQWKWTDKNFWHLVNLIVARK